MERISLAIVLFNLAVFIMPADKRADQTTSTVDISVHTSNIINIMRLGLGASWHATQGPIIHPHSGSAWGGNPPWDQTSKWTQIKNHTNWLGLDFCRVENEQNIDKSTTHGTYTWDSDEMKALYNILDRAQQNNVDIFLQQMWQRVDWNVLSGLDTLITTPPNVDWWTRVMPTCHRKCRSR